MTSTLRQIQADYEARATFAQMLAEIPEVEEWKPKATRTYTGAALEKRRQWGYFWGALNAEHARKLRSGEVN